MPINGVLYYKSQVFMSKFDLKNCLHHIVYSIVVLIIKRILFYNKLSVMTVTYIACFQCSESPWMCCDSKSTFCIFRMKWSQCWDTFLNLTKLFKLSTWRVGKTLNFETCPSLISWPWTLTEKAFYLVYKKCCLGSTVQIHILCSFSTVYKGRI